MSNRVQCEEPCCSEQRHKLSLTIVPLWFIAALIAIALIGFFAPSVQAKAIATAAGGNAVITLFDEDCTLKAVSNLPKRATWVENGKTFEGCWAPNPDMGVVAAYFDDRSVAVIPIQIFQRAVGA